MANSEAVKAVANLLSKASALSFGIGIAGYAASATLFTGAVLIVDLVASFGCRNGVLTQREN